LVLVAGCAGAPSVPTEPVTPDYARSSLVWSGEGRMFFALKATERDGQVWLCSAYSPRNRGLFRDEFNREALTFARIELGGETLTKNLTDMTRSGRDGRFEEAGCTLTDVPWRPEFASMTPEVKLARTRFELQISNRRFTDIAQMGAANQPTFNQKPKAVTPKVVPQAKNGSEWVRVE
jgi:hypothetical protein